MVSILDQKLNLVAHREMFRLYMHRGCTADGRDIIFLWSAKIFVNFWCLQLEQFWVWKMWNSHQEILTSDFKAAVLAPWWGATLMLAWQHAPSDDANANVYCYLLIFSV